MNLVRHCYDFHYSTFGVQANCCLRSMPTDHLENHAHNVANKRTVSLKLAIMGLMLLENMTPFFVKIGLQYKCWLWRLSVKWWSEAESCHCQGSIAKSQNPAAG